MAKNIKDIVDEGFTKLASLAEKRNEILERSQQIANASSGPQFEAASSKVKTAETAYIAEINSQVDHLLSELRQTLAQVAENNQFFQGSTRDKLTMQVSGLLAELNHTETHSLSATSERLDSLLTQTNKERQAHETSISAETANAVAELENLVGRNRAALTQSHAEICGKLTHNQNELSALLLEAGNAAVQSAEKKRHKAFGKLEKFARTQFDDLTKSTRELDKKVETLVSKSLDTLKDSCIKTETELDKKRDTIANSAITEIKSISKESLAQLEDSYDYSRKELSEKLTALLELTKTLLQQEQLSLSERDNAMRGSADTVCNELRNAGLEGVAGAKRSPVEEAFAEVTDDLNDIAADLNRKIKDLLKSQAEAMTKLCASAEKSYLDLFTEFMNEIKDNMKVQNQLCAQKEEELLKQLETLAKQISATRAQLNGGGGAS